MNKSKKDNIVFKKRLYIYYLLFFQKKIIWIKALINYSNKVNIIMLIYFLKLDLKICYINIKNEKIDSLIVEIFEMVLTSF